MKNFLFLLFKNTLYSFGFHSMDDLLNSCLHVKTIVLKNILLAGLILGTFGGVIQEYIGLEPIVFFMIILLFSVEFLTGVGASVYIKKQRFNSWKVGRMVLKILVYSLILVIFNILGKGVNPFSILTFDFNFFKWVYYIVLNLLVLQLLISVLENLELLGFKEIKPFLKVFKKKQKDIEGKDLSDIPPEGRDKFNDNNE